MAKNNLLILGRNFQIPALVFWAVKFLPPVDHKPAIKRFLFQKGVIFWDENHWYADLIDDSDQLCKFSNNTFLLEYPYGRNYQIFSINYEPFLPSK